MVQQVAPVPMALESAVLSALDVVVPLAQITPTYLKHLQLALQHAPTKFALFQQTSVRSGWILRNLLWLVPLRLQERKDSVLMIA